MQNLYLRQAWSLNRSTSKQAEVGVNVGDGQSCWPELAIVGDKSTIILDHTAWQNFVKAKPAIDEFFARKSSKLKISLGSLTHDTSVSGHIGSRILICLNQTAKQENYTRFMYIAEATVAQLFKIQELIDHVFDMVNRSSSEICGTVQRFLIAKETGKEIVMYDAPNTCTGLSMKSLMHELVLYDTFFDRE